MDKTSDDKIIVNENWDNELLNLNARHINELWGWMAQFEEGKISETELKRKIQESDRKYEELKKKVAD